MYCHVPSLAKCLSQPGCVEPPFGKKSVWPTVSGVPIPKGMLRDGMSVWMTSTYSASLGSNRNLASRTLIKWGPAGSNPVKRGHGEMFKTARSWYVR